MADENIGNEMPEVKDENTENEMPEVKADSHRIIRNHVLASMGVGLIPLPVVDLVGITAVQLNMLRKLSSLYEVPFSENMVKNILSALIGGAGSLPVARVLSSFVKLVPVLGHTVGALSMPISAGAITYAVGKVFLMHFASGGTLLTFNPEKVRDYYAEMLKEGKTIAAGLKV